jgi:hypothetical protein
MKQTKKKKKPPEEVVVQSRAPKLWHATHPTSIYCTVEKRITEQAGKHRAPVLDAGAGLHGLELGGDAGGAPIGDLVQVHERRVPDQLRTGKIRFFYKYSRGRRRSAKERAGAHLGDVVSDGRRRLSHWCQEAEKSKGKRSELALLTESEWKGSSTSWRGEAALKRREARAKVAKPGLRCTVSLRMGPLGNVTGKWCSLNLDGVSCCR